MKKNWLKSVYIYFGIYAISILFDVAIVICCKSGGIYIADMDDVFADFYRVIVALINILIIYFFSYRKSGTKYLLFITLASIIVYVCNIHVIWKSILELVAQNSVIITGQVLISLCSNFSWIYMMFQFWKLYKHNKTLRLKYKSKNETYLKEGNEAINLPKD